MIFGYLWISSKVVKKIPQQQPADPWSFSLRRPFPSGRETTTFPFLVAHDGSSRGCPQGEISTVAVVNKFKNGKLGTDEILIF